METAGQIGMIDDFYIKPLLGIIKYTTKPLILISQN